MMGVIGINSIEDDSYQKYLLMYKASEDPLDNAGNAGAAKKYSLYPFGMSEKLFVPKSEHDHIKDVFNKFKKSLETEFTQKEKVFQQYIDQKN